MSTQAAADHRSGRTSPPCWQYKNLQMQFDISGTLLLHFYACVCETLIPTLTITQASDVGVARVILQMSACCTLERRFISGENWYPIVSLQFIGFSVLCSSGSCIAMYASEAGLKVEHARLAGILELPASKAFLMDLSRT